VWISKDDLGGPPHRRRLRVERLEDRTLLSIGPSGPALELEDPWQGTAVVEGDYISSRGDIVLHGSVSSLRGHITLDAGGSIHLLGGSLLSADGGTITLIAAGHITASGSVEARSVEGHSGHIELIAGGDVLSDGTLRANTLTERGASFCLGGVVDVEAATVENDDGAVELSTGSFNVDIFDTENIIVRKNAVVTLTDSISLVADSNQDGTGRFTMRVGSRIVADGHSLDVYGSEDGILRDVENVASLALHQSKLDSNPTYFTGHTYGLPTPVLHNCNLYVFTGGGHDGTSDDPYTVANVYDLQSINVYPDDHYRLDGDIDAAETSAFNGGKGFYPIGDSLSPFRGSFDGQAATVSGLFIDRSGQELLGLFGYTNGARISDVRLCDVNVLGGKKNVGALVAYQYGGTIVDCRVSGIVSGVEYVGGFVGNNSGTIVDSSAIVTVNGVRNVGGFAGFQYYGTIEDSFAAGNVSGVDEVGGFIGLNRGTIEGCFAVGDVSGTSENTGGMVGQNRDGTVVDSYALGNIAGATKAGGLVGRSEGSRGVIEDCYAGGNVFGISEIGGLVGELDEGRIESSFAAGLPTGNKRVGSLLGNKDDGGGIVRDCYYVSRYYPNGYGTLERDGIDAFKTTAHPVYWIDGMVAGSPAWDFITPVWKIVEDRTLPYLAWQSLVIDRHVFYNGSAFDGGDPLPGQADQAAIATDKDALLPGRTAGLVNYTSYSRGINGIMVDIANLPGIPTADDFEFRAGNDDDPRGWRIVAEVPGVDVRPGHGVSGSDRVTIVWPDNTIRNEWLQVKVLRTANTGLADGDVFYFGNTPGESGNSASEARVNAVDVLLARNHPHGTTFPASVTSRYDFNRDKRVNATDMLIARGNQTHLLNGLRLISVPEIGEVEGQQADDAAVAASVDWLYELQAERLPNKQPSDKDDAVDEAVWGPMHACV